MSASLTPERLPDTPAPAGSDPFGLPPVEGAAFTPTIKALSVLLVLGIGFYVVRLWPEQALATLGGQSLGFMAATLVVVLACLAYICGSRVRIDATHIEQTWLWRKRVAIAEISQLKFIYVPYLSWLIAPRLVVRQGVTGWYVFHAADRQVLQRFYQLALRGAKPLDP
ncbi:MAG: hypothetical protein EBT70_07770 [Betaproteobacteria bacterium]|nr:hypothetical protein [Betaproteobacteria bacterium]